MRIIKSFDYISTSIISSLKLKMGIINTDLNIKMKTSDYAKLMFLRNQAYTDKSRKYVQKKYKKTFKAILNTQTQKFNSTIRLKGDGRSTHYQPNKWSMKLNLQNSNLMGMNSFNLQHPQRRSFLSSFIFHLFTKHEGIPTIKFGLMTVSINHKKMGLYNYEEIPSIEMYQREVNKRGIPIFFQDDLHMNEDTRTNLELFNEILNAPVTTYNLKKSFRNPDIRRNLETASRLLYNFKKKKIKTLDIFDHKLATYLVLIDIFGGKHGLGLNTRMFYDFASNKLIPTPWDNFTENNSVIGSEQNLSLLNNDPFVKLMFADKDFLSLYLKEHYRINNKNYFQKVINLYKKDLDDYLDKLLLFYPQVTLDTEINKIIKNSQYLNRVYLRTSTPTIIYKSTKNTDDTLLFVNRKPIPIHIKKIINISNNEECNIISKNNNLLPGHINISQYEPISISFKCKYNNYLAENDVNDLRVLISRLGEDKDILVKINDVVLDTN